MDRRSSEDGHHTPRHNTNPNVFDDEYALDGGEDDFMPAVSDGFRPTTSAQEGGDSDRQDHDRNEPQPPPLTATKSAETDLRRVATRNSTTKGPCARESTSPDGQPPAGPDIRGPSSQATGSPRRASGSSTASFATMARPESLVGAAPSHPYGMYPQNTVARPSSVATSSTQPQPHRSLSLQRPTHPYAMYSQTVVEDEPPLETVPTVPTVQTAAPAGYPSIDAGFHRRIGPDGEEQDIIGPDGHTEQLPPYSRFPEEGPTKAALAAEASATPVESVPSPLASSNDDLPSPLSPLSAHLPPSRPETQSRDITLAEPAAAPAAPAPATPTPAPTLSPSPATASLAEQGVSEKEEHASSGKRWYREKVWGKLSRGLLVFLIVVALLLGVVLGAAIGARVARNKGKRFGSEHSSDGAGDDPAAQVTGPSSLFDATPIPTPTALANLPAGNFSLPLGIAQESSPGCLRQPNQLSAWSCKMTFAPLKLTINNTLLSRPDQAQSIRPMASMEAFTKPDGGIQYGLQPPQLVVQPMQLVLDLDYKAYGPAWHFSARYDKIVILKPDEFVAGASLKKRDDDKPSFRHRFQVMPGDSPWYCFWNETYIEGYIYVEDNSTAASLTSFPTAWPSMPFDTTIPVETAMPLTAATDATVASSAQSTPPPSPVERRGDSDYPRLPPYPRIVKIEERRIPGSPQAFCQKMLLLDNGQLTESQSASGDPIKVFLQEEDPTLDEFFAGDAPGRRKRRALQERGDPSDACHCQWMFQ
ncbi:hypothetical protein BDV95DRAFT_610475 [Massariosphaeria phaeospora]|uniref:DUF7820 domain-containing protein n=1 Tax=Massariosphaeria phaeospora TaxID=100035 RepID=A0A7C8M4X4_9PLEO|nr:hypothetical protein BDV95DRAFT_610475 [Massariosphaeria phaeospora]